MFITFEGGEGSGKSWQARALFRRLARLSIPAILIREPGSTPLGERLARLLKRHQGLSISPLSELLLFNASRSQLVEDVIRPALLKSQVVVCDRFSDSTVAYQGYGRGMDLAQVRSVNTLATGALKPDLTLLFDIPARQGLARKKGTDVDRFERERVVFHERVRRGYLALAAEEPDRFRVLDGAQAKQVIAGAVWEHVKGLLAGRPDRTDE